jgi:hypothetical protein
MADETPQELSLIDKAEAVAKRIEEANKKSAELLERHEQALAKQLLGGRSEAGYIAPVVDPIKAEKDRINKILEKTGFKI